MHRSWRPDVVLARRLEIAGSRFAPSQVRGFLDEMLVAHLRETRRFDLGVLVSEVVTNAVRHGGADQERTVVVHVALAQDVVRVEVCDPGPGFVAPSRPRPNPRGGGNGLVLLDRMSSRWGVAVDDGTCVWFERDLSVADYL